MKSYLCFLNTYYDTSGVGRGGCGGTYPPIIEVGGLRPPIFMAVAVLYSVTD